ncbi:major capsid protein [Brevundimonas sp.]|uniref:major capsid protein n=1 Tax=Brevundimonas sp. TaxID=1871086 RepID=UPI0035B1759A
MAVLGNTFLNLLDVHRGTEPGAVLEILSQTAAIAQDAFIGEANRGTYHEHSIRTGLPSVAWGALYQGIPQSKGHTQVVKDTTGFVEALSSIDERLLQIEPEKAGQVRLAEASGFLEAMSQEWESGVFYHDTATAPEKFKGLSARYNSTANPNVVSAGGSGSDNTSVWFVTWGESFTSLIHPKGTPGGIVREDKGSQRITDASGNPYYVKEELFRLHTGVSVGDWRYNARVCNIDVSDLAAGNVDIYRQLTKAYYRLQGRKVARPGNQIMGGKPAPRTVMYCNRNVLEALDVIATNKGASDNFVRLRPMEVEGQEVLTWRGIPIRETDALLNTEAAVS